MKNGKQRRIEIRAKRLKRAKSRENTKIDAPWLLGNGTDEIASGYVLADPEQLVHNTTYSPMPLYYEDRAFVCHSCGEDDLWTAKQQKWWYEIAKGNIDSVAICCRPCRKIKRQEKFESRKRHFTGLINKYGIEHAAKTIGRSQEDLEKLLDSFTLK